MMRNPFVTRGMIKSKRGFWGRAYETATIYSLLLDSEDEPQSVAVVGLRRIGKSSLLYNVAQTRGAPEMYDEQLERTVCVMLSLQSLSGASTELFFERILEELRCRGDAVSMLLDKLSSQSITDSGHEVKKLLRAMDREGYLLVLLLDEFECAAANPSFDKHFFDLLRSLAQEWRLAFVVVTQCNLDELWDKSLISSPYSSPFFNFFQTIALGGFRDDEVEDYLKTASSEAGLALGPSEIEVITDVGGTHPFFLNVAAYHVFQSLTNQGDKPLADRCALWTQITQDPTVSGNFRYYWENLTPSRRQLLGDAAKEGLSELLAPEAQVDLAWLERMCLMREQNRGLSVPFSNAFREAVLHLSQGDPESERPDHERTLQDLISEDESATLELKSSLRWDYRQNKKNDAVSKAAVKTLAAFLNTDGGTLIIGVDDERNILGLEKDYSTLKKRNRDGFELLLMDLISTNLGERFCQYSHTSFSSIDGFDVCKIAVDTSPEPVYVGSEADFLIRTGNSTRKLSTKEAVAYIGTHWA